MLLQQDKTQVSITQKNKTARATKRDGWVLVGFELPFTEVFAIGLWWTNHEGETDQRQAVEIKETKTHKKTIRKQHIARQEQEQELLSFSSLCRCFLSSTSEKTVTPIYSISFCNTHLALFCEKTSTIKVMMNITKPFLYDTLS